MAFLIVKTEDRPEVRKWFDETVERSVSENLYRNPLKWKLRHFKKGRDLYLAIDASLLMFNFSMFGWVTGLGVFIIWGYHWVLWPCVVVGMLGYFWTSDFIYQMTKLALRRKAKYAGSIKRVKLSEFIKEVVM